MTNTRYNLRIGDFKKLIRLVIFYMLGTFSALGIFFYLISVVKIDPEESRVTYFLVGYFILSGISFLVLLKKNYTTEEVGVDSQSLHTNRFGTIYFSDVRKHWIQRQKHSEDLVLTLLDGRRISFGPVKQTKDVDKAVYINFKSQILPKITKS